MKSRELEWLLGLSGDAGELLGAAVGVARTSVENDAVTDQTAPALWGALRAVRDGGDFGPWRTLLRQEKAALAPNCVTCESPCGRMADYPPESLLTEEEPVQEAKAHLLWTLMEQLDDCDPAQAFPRVRDALFRYSWERDAERLELPERSM